MPGLMLAVERDGARPPRGGPLSSSGSMRRPIATAGRAERRVPAPAARRLRQQRLRVRPVVVASRHRDHRRRDLRERLGQRVDRLRELARVGLRQLRVEHVPVAAPVLARAPLSTAAKRCSISSEQLPGPSAVSERLDALERRLRAVDVRLEVDEVGVRVALLLAGDLRRRDLVQQLDRAVGDLCGLELDRSALRRCSCSRRRAARRRPASCPRSCRRPQRLLDAVEAVHSSAGTSPARASISGSRSPKLSATGSILS